MKPNISLSMSLRKTKFAPVYFSGDFENGVRCAAELGYQRVEIGILDSAAVDHAEIRRILSANGMKALTIATGQSYVEEGFSLFGGDDRGRAGAVERLKGHADFAAELGAAVIIGGIRGKLPDGPGIVDGPGGSSGSDCSSSSGAAARVRAEEAGIEAVRECVSYGKRIGVPFFIEAINRYETNCGNTMRETISYIDRVGMDNLRLLADTFHMNIEEASMDGSLLDARDYLGYIHFADSNRLPPGEGHIDFPAILKALDTIGYTGFIGVETLPLPDDRAGAETAIRYIERTAAVLD